MEGSEALSFLPTLQPRGPHGSQAGSFDQGPKQAAAPSHRQLSKPAPQGTTLGWGQGWRVRQATRERGSPRPRLADGAGRPHRHRPESLAGQTRHLGVWLRGARAGPAEGPAGCRGWVGGRPVYLPSPPRRSIAPLQPVYGGEQPLPLGKHSLQRAGFSPPSSPHSH